MGKADKVEDDISELTLAATSDQDEAAAREHGRVIARYYKSVRENGVPANLAADLTRYYTAWYLGETGDATLTYEESETDDEDE